MSWSKSKELKKKPKKDDTESEEEKVKAHSSLISEKVCLTWKKGSDAKGGKKTFIADHVKKARD